MHGVHVVGLGRLEDLVELLLREREAREHLAVDERRRLHGLDDVPRPVGEQEDEDGVDEAVGRCLLGTGKGEGESPPQLEVRAAPEPEEIRWENLQLTDEHEEAVEKKGYTALGIVMLIGLFLLSGVKLSAVSVKETMAEDPEVAGTGTETFVNLAMTCMVSGTTVVFNGILNALIAKITAAEGQDTITEEQASLFSKLSVAFVINQLAWCKRFVGRRGKRRIPK